MHTLFPARLAVSRTLALSAVLGLAALLPASAQTHAYTLNGPSGSFTDANGGPSLIPDGGTLLPSGYTFNPNEGLSLGNVLNESDYSITLTFSLSSIDRCDKLLDFRDKSSDNGLYLYYGKLDFYPITGDPGANVFAADQSQTVNLTRNGATQVVTGSVGGVEQFSFVDTAGIAVFDAPDNRIHFFEDDNATAGREAAGGTVTGIVINGSGAPVPEVSTTVSLGLLLMLGFGGAVVAAKKKKSVA